MCVPSFCVDDLRLLELRQKISESEYCRNDRKSVMISNTNLVDFLHLPFVAKFVYERGRT